MVRENSDLYKNYIELCLLLHSIQLQPSVEVNTIQLRTFVEVNIRFYGHDRLYSPRLEAKAIIARQGP